MENIVKFKDFFEIIKKRLGKSFFLLISFQDIILL
jgi:hypothetical protein